MNTRLRTPEELEGTTEDRRLDPTLVIVVVACLLPYINLGPISTPSEIQPWGGILAWLWVGARSLRTGVRITPFQWLLLFFAGYFMVNVYGGEGFDPSLYLRRSGAYLLCAGIFLACQYLTPATLWRALKIATPVWLMFGVLRYVDGAIYYAVVTPLVPNVFSSDSRGTSSLAPEATDFGFTMVFIVTLCMITRRRLTQQGLRAEKWPIVTAVASVLISFSGTGYLGLAVIGSVYLLTSPAIKYGMVGRSLIALVVAASTVIIMSLLPSQSIRGVELLRLAIQDPISLMDTTTSYRIVHGTVGALGLVDSGYLGYGAGSFQSEAVDVYYRHSLGGVFQLRNHYETNVPATLSNNPSSQIAVLLLEFGVVGVVYLLLIFGFAVRSRIPFKAIAVMILALAWLGSFPAAWPPFWLVIGIMMSPNFVNKKGLSHGESQPPEVAVQRRSPLAPKNGSRHHTGSTHPHWNGLASE